jgi:hypothetical protein
MAMDFPNSPVVGQVFSSGSRQWVWTGTTWDSPAAGTPGIVSSTGGTFTGDITAPNYAGRGNAIINGAFDIWQRGTSFTVSSGSFFADRFAGEGGGTATRQSSGSPSSSNFHLRCAFPVSSFLNFWQIIESQNAKSFWGKQVTLSLKLRRSSGLTSNLSVQIQRNSTLNASSFTAGWTNVATTTVLNGTLPTGTGSADWLTVNLTTTIPNDSTANTLRVVVAMSAIQDSSSYYEVAEVQLEAGTIATPFKRNANSLQGELAACQRYYQRINFLAESNFSTFAHGSAYSTTAALVVVKLNEMRRFGISLDFANLVLDDGINTPVVTALTLAGNRSNSSFATLVPIVSSGLTQFRPYLLRGNDTNNSFVGISAEL